MSWFNKKKQTATELTIFPCSVDQNLPECSLIEQLKKLQKQSEELVNKQELPTLKNYFSSEFIHSNLAYISVLNLNNLSNCSLQKINSYINDLINYQTNIDDINRKKSEIDKQINDIKSQLGIK